MTPDPLLVTIATSGRIAPWQVRCVETLAAVPGVSITRWLRSVDPRSSDESLVGGVVPDALRAVDVFEIGNSRPEALAVLAERPTDLLLDLSPPGEPVPLAWASEVWRYRFGRDLSRDLSQVALLNYVRGVGVIHVALVRAMDETVIHEGWMETVSWWHPSELERVMRAPAGWAAAAARQRTARVQGTESPPCSDDKPETPLADGSRSRRGSAPPSSVMTVGAIGRRILGMAENLVLHDDWNVGILDRSIDSLLMSPDARPTMWLPVPTGHFAADPFGVERAGVLHVFFEDFDHRRAIGSIHHVAIGIDGRASAPEPALEPGMHASYPFLIEYEGATFMLPEVSASGDLVLFEATHFPYDWRAVATLLPGIPAVDASIIQFEDRWWMFACRSDHGANQDLFIWHSPDLLGPWAAHEGNPVKTDARSSRSGGTPFVSDGTLYRPSQDDSEKYGGRLVINEVVALTPTTFAERPVQVIGPTHGSSHPDGLHTVSAVGRRTLIDGNRRHFVSDALRYELALYARRIGSKVGVG